MRLSSSIKVKELSNDFPIGNEPGSIHKNWKNHHRIALVYPNTYAIGMTNLGFQRLYQCFNDREDFLCERVFLPEDRDPKPKLLLKSCESGRSLQDFDILAFSISFETDYVNVLRILKMAGIPLRSQDRRKGRFPVILAGGCGITVNPEPLSDFIDLFCIGEGEAFIDPFCDSYSKNRPIKELLEGFCQIPGVYVPSHYEFSYEGNLIKEIRQIGTGPKKILRLITKNLDPVPTQTVVIPVESPFRNMFMIETGRGCKWACRFCASGYIYRFPREKGFQALKEACDQALKTGMRIGLVGSDMSCHSYIWDLMEYILDQGGEPSLSSIRVEAIDERMASLIARTGIRTMTLAPDGGSFRLRRVLNKNMPDEMVEKAAERLLDAGIKNIKLYFMIGLPTEEERDIKQLIILCEKIRNLMKARASKLGYMGMVSLSINPFIPKPGTPFQWVGLEPKKIIEKRFQMIRKALVPQGNFKVELESYRSCYLQAFFSRGDRRAGQILERMLETGHSIDQCAKEMVNELQYIPKNQIHRTWDFSEELPWGLMDHGFHPGYLEKEMRRGYQTKLIPLCDPKICHLCGIC